jgi:hypothetical protein
MKTIEIDDDIYESLQSLAIPFVETNPNMVIRRIVERYTGSKSKTVPLFPKTKRRASRRGFGKLSSIYYREPIIEALKELGGSANVYDVLDLVYQKVKDQLTEIDLSETLTGNKRWWNTAQWERHLMVKDGLVKSDSPRGIWELNPQYTYQVKNPKTDILGE